MEARVYSVGLCHCSVCHPKAWTKEQIEAFANNSKPTGIDSKWKVDPAPTFANGAPNPTACHEEPELYLHTLMVC